MTDGFNYSSNTPLVGSVAAGSAFLGELVVLPFFDAQYLKSLEELEELGGLIVIYIYIYIHSDSAYSS